MTNLGAIDVRGLLRGAINRLRTIATELPQRASGAWTEAEISEQFDALLARLGEPSAISLAGAIIARYGAASHDERNLFLSVLARGYGADADRLERAIVAFQTQRDAAAIAEIHAASESRRQHIIQGLNQPPGGTLMLLRMREHGLRNRHSIPDFAALDVDFSHVLAAWFNRGFLNLHRISWSSPASVLRKLIDYEAVHEIRDWEDLRRRVEPSDRRCYAFFHPQMPEEPLIFVEVALTTGVPSSIQALLSDTRVTNVASPTTAVFYSISNCQDGLRGVAFGSFLIKQTAELLKRELPSLRTFMTLSPVPSFAQWVEEQRNSSDSELRAEELARLADFDLTRAGELPITLADVLMPALARYLTKSRGGDGRPLDPVAKFHLGNGAQLEHIHWLADTSAKGLKQSFGLMVNYLYDLKHIEANQATLHASGEVAASNQVHKMARLQRREPVPARA